MVNKVEKLTMKQLYLEDLEQMMLLQEEVHKLLDDPSLCVQLSKDEINELLVEETGLTVGFFDDNKLIGFHSALKPGIRSDNLGYELNLQNDVLGQVFHLEICLVHPDYRGKALQSKMAQWLVEQILLDGNYRYLCETVAPHNISSIKNTLAINTLIVQLKELSGVYGGYERYIFFQDSQAPLKINESTKKDVSLEDKALQKQLFALGYVGYDLVLEQDQWKLLLALPIENRIPYK